MRLFKLILQFYLTLGIPLLYLLILYFIAQTPQTFPNLIILQTPISQIIYLVSSIIGLLLWIFSFYHLRHGFGVLPGNKTRISSGPYKYFSHPMYLGIFLLFNGLALITSSFPGFLTNLFILTPINFARAKLESKQLTP